MGFKASSAKRMAASSAVAGSIVVLPSTDGTGPTLSGGGITATTTIKTQVVTPGTTTSGSTSVASGLKITNVYVTNSSYTVLDDTALDPAGGYLKIIGTGFLTGCVAYINGSSLTTTFVSSTEIRVVVPAESVGAYSLMIFNTDGNGAIYLNLGVSNFPTFTTSAGTLGSVYETLGFTQSVAATGDTPLTYSLYSGSLPPGATLSANGAISGTSQAESGSSTYSFVVNVKDAQGQDTTRSFSLTINTDVVSWSTPASGATYTLPGNVAMANVTLSASSAAGYGVQYTADTLPTGVTLSNGTLYGTPTTTQSISTTLTATANTTGRSATRTISWSISLGDTYWKYVTLLMNGITSSNTFINDASTNNAQLTVAGDTKPNNFNPYSEGYYSGSFNGSTDYISLPASSNFDFGSGAFTVECWIYQNSVTSTVQTVAYHGWSGNGGLNYGWNIQTVATTNVLSFYANGSQYSFSDLVVPTNRWVHIAFCGTGGVLSAYMNGVKSSTTPTYTSIVARATGTLVLGGWGNNSETIGERWWFGGQISNFRVVKGTALYSASFTPPTTPLTAVANTQALLCQSSRFIDNSLNYAPVTIVTAKVSSTQPFVTPTTASYNIQYSTYFNGSTDYITAASAASAFAFGTGDFTIEFWVYPIAVSGVQYLISTAAGGSSNQFVLSVASAGAVRIFNAGTNGTYAITANTALTLNSWNHVAISRTSGTMLMYIRGILQTQTDTTNINYTSGSTVVIGATNLGAGIFQGGYISNLRVIKGTGLYPSGCTVPTSPLTAISGTSLLTCQSSTLRDNSTNAFTFTSAGQAQPIVLSPFTQTTSNNTVTNLGSAYVDGSGDYLVGNGSNAMTFGTGDFTVEYWVYPTAFIATYQQHIGGATTSNGFAFGLDGSNNIYKTTQSAGASGVTPLVANRWYHIAWTRSSGTVRGFINGVQDYTATDTTNITETTFSIGATNTGTYPCGASYLADMRVVKGQALYTANFLPPQAPLTAVANTSLLTAQSNGGATNNGFVDQSGFNNITTRTGSVSQGTFSPYSQTGWSSYFSTKTDYISVPATTPLTTFAGDFTFEAWIYPTDTTIAYWKIWDSRQIGASAAKTVLGLEPLASPVAGQGRLDYYNGAHNYSTGTVYYNQWTHIAFVRSGSTLTFYINGSASGTATVSGTQTGAATTNPIYIAGTKDTGASYGVLGYISNFRVVNGTAIVPPSGGPTTPLTAVANTVLLTHQSNGFIDNSPYNNTLTVSGTASVQAFSPFGGVTSVPTTYSNYFDGTGDYLSLAHNTALNLSSGDFTIEAWVYNTLNTANATIIEKDGVFSSTYYSYNLGFDGTGKVIFGVGSGNSTAYVQTIGGSTSLSLNTWYHIAAVKSGTTLSLYINGTLNASATQTGTIVDGGKVALIGYQTGQASSFYWNGYISNLRVVKGTAIVPPSGGPIVPLTAVANTTLLTCQSNTIVDNSTNYFTLTANGDVKPKTFNPFGQTTTTQVAYSPSVNGGSMYFSGDGNDLSVPAGSLPYLGTSNFTIDFWYYPTSFQSYSVIIAQNANTNAASNWDVFITSAGAVLFEAYTGSTLIATTSAAMPLNAWTHVACVRNGSTFTVYLNGVASGTPASSAGALNSNALATRMGRNESTGTSRGILGYVSDLRFSVGALYTSAFYPPSAPAIPTTTIGTTTYSSQLLLTGTSGGIVDAHSSGNFETVGNVQLSPITPYTANTGGKSIYFDGSGDYLLAPNTPKYQFGTGDYTVEYWLYPTSFAATGVHVDFRTVNAATGGAIQIYTTTGGVVTVYGGSSTATLLITGGAITLGAWTHIALVRQSGVGTTLYINGVRSGPIANDTTTYGLGALWVGQGAGGSNYTGHMKDLRITKGTARYTANTSAPTTTFLSK